MKMFFGVMGLVVGLSGCAVDAVGTDEGTTTNEQALINLYNYYRAMSSCCQAAYQQGGGGPGGCGGGNCCDQISLEQAQACGWQPTYNQ